MTSKRKLPLANLPLRSSQRLNHKSLCPRPNDVPILLLLPLEILLLFLDFAITVKGQWGTSTFVADFGVLARVCHPLLKLTKDAQFLDSLFQRGLYFVEPVGQFERIMRWKMGLLIQDSAFNIASGAPLWGNLVRTNNIFSWKGSLIVPEPSPFSSKAVVVNIRFGIHFPFKPLVVEFEDCVFHPNVDKDGKLCVPILGKDWSPSCCLISLLWHIITIMGMPYVHDDYDIRNKAMKLYLRCPKLYHERAYKLYNEKVCETVLPVLRTHPWSSNPK
jgi:ubiquitin-protein ligase